MSQLSLTYSDVQGSQKNIDHIRQNFTDVKSFLNGTSAAGGGNLDATNTTAAFAKDNVEPAFAVWKTVFTAVGPVVGTIVVGTYSFTQSGDIVTSGAGNSHIPLAAWFDPADWTAGSRSTKYRVACTVFVNGTAPAATITAGLYPVTPSGAANLLALTLGTVTSGSTAAVASPSPNSTNHAESSAFAAPSAGAYTLGVAVSGGTVAANNVCGVSIRLQAQQV